MQQPVLLSRREQRQIGLPRKGWLLALMRARSQEIQSQAEDLSFQCLKLVLKTRS